MYTYIYIYIYAGRLADWQTGRPARPFALSLRPVPAHGLAGWPAGRLLWLARRLLSQSKLSQTKHQTSENPLPVGTCD